MPQNKSLSHSPLRTLALAITLGVASQTLAADDTTLPEDEGLGRHGHVDSNGVKIHYVTQGEGPLIVLIHGFPDYWYTWRQLMPELAKRNQVVAIDQRGYNLSDQPKGVENYTMDKLVADVVSVVDHFGQPKATIIGHDWGGAVAWTFAMTYPEKTDRLVVLNLPHPHCLARELATNPKQRANSAYARGFQMAGAHKIVAPGMLVGFVSDAASREKYIAAFERSSIEGMLNYYKANYPREPYKMPESDPTPVQSPVLLIHGLKDKALLPGALNDTWQYVDNELTLVTIPDADHWVHHDAPDRVNRAIACWLASSDR